MTTIPAAPEAFSPHGPRTWARIQVTAAEAVLTAPTDTAWSANRTWNCRAPRSSPEAPR
ncbi:hypothetical protein ACFU6M_36005 [Streptomyces bottropensis]|uniref:hypothetical protein n=1 Tax=Streptomyces bottropensis TaxID=42235 RepID=UPI00367FEF02